MSRWDHFCDKLGFVWWGFVCALQVLCGPICVVCRETSWSERSAHRKGWRWTTCYDGDTHWRCGGCMADDAERPEW